MVCFLYFPSKPFAPWRGAKVGNQFLISKNFANFFFFSFSPGNSRRLLSLKRAAKVSRTFLSASTWQNFFFLSLSVRLAFLPEARTKVQPLSPFPQAFSLKKFSAFRRLHQGLDPVLATLSVKRSRPKRLQRYASFFSPQASVESFFSEASLFSGRPAGGHCPL